MGITEVLTIVFVILKLCGVIDWNWFFVLLPEIIAAGLYVLFFILAAAQSISIGHQFNKEFKRFDDERRFR